MPKMHLRGYRTRISGNPFVSTLDLAHGDTLTQADMEDLTSLTAQSSQISSITGLEHATSLTRLDLKR